MVLLLLTAVKVGILGEQTSIAVIGYALRSLVHPSLGLGVFLRTVPPNGASKPLE